MTKMLDKFVKVNENITINRYDNGWMIEISGRNKDNDWKSSKTLCVTEEELLSLIKKWNSMDLDN